MLKYMRRGRLFEDLHCSHKLIFAAVLLLLLVQRCGLVFLQAVIALTDDSLDGRELARLLLDTHDDFLVALVWV